MRDFYPQVLAKGQPFLDQPIQILPKKLDKLEVALAQAFNSRIFKQPITVGWKRVRLVWDKN